MMVNINWPAELERMERRQWCDSSADSGGPEDEFDDEAPLEANGDPDSLEGDEDERGFEEMADWPDESGLEGDFDPPEGEEDDDDPDDDGDEEDEC